MATEKHHSVEGRKKFFLDLKENNRGRLLKVTEDVGGRRDTIMIPVGDLREIAALMVRLADYSDATP